MAADLQRLISCAQEEDPTFLLHVGEQWGSEIENFRTRLREDISHTLSPGEDFSDLKERPQLPTHSISISHARGLGGWASVARPSSVGFDVEGTERLTPELVQRISKPQELALTPDPRLLWGAKESSFKALAGHKITVISTIQIGAWSKLEDNLFKFELAANRSATGFALIANKYIYSICLIKSVSV